jgi:hypothetical protein
MFVTLVVTLTGTILTNYNAAGARGLARGLVSSRSERFRHYMFVTLVVTLTGTCDRGLVRSRS